MQFLYYLDGRGAVEKLQKYQKHQYYLKSSRFNFSNRYFVAYVRSNFVYVMKMLMRKPFAFMFATSAFDKFFQSQKARRAGF